MNKKLLMKPRLNGEFKLSIVICSAITFMKLYSENEDTIVFDMQKIIISENIARTIIR